MSKKEENCSIDECSNKVRCKKMCRNHYIAFLKQEKKEEYNNLKEKNKKLENEVKDLKKELETNVLKYTDEILKLKQELLLYLPQSTKQNISQIYEQETEKDEIILYNEDNYKNKIRHLSSKKTWTPDNWSLLKQKFKVFEIIEKEFFEKKKETYSKNHLENIVSETVVNRLKQDNSRFKSSLGQFYQILFWTLEKKESIILNDITWLFSIPCLKLYLKTLKDLEKSPKTIKNTFDALKRVLKKLKGIEGLKIYFLKIDKAFQFIKDRCGSLKTLIKNLPKIMSPELFLKGNFMDDQEIATLIIRYLNEIKLLIIESPEELDIKKYMELQNCVFTILLFLSNGLRLECITNLEINSVKKLENSYFITINKEKTERVFHEIPVFNLFAALTLLLEKYRIIHVAKPKIKKDINGKIILNEQNEEIKIPIKSLFINSFGEVNTPNSLMEKFNYTLKKYNPFLSIGSLNLRRLIVSQMFSLELNNEINLKNLASYLNNSVQTILTHYNRSTIDLKNTLKLVRDYDSLIEDEEIGEIQDILKEINEENIIFKRYQRFIIEDEEAQLKLDEWCLNFKEYLKTKKELNLSNLEINQFNNLKISPICETNKRKSDNQILVENYQNLMKKLKNKE